MNIAPHHKEQGFTLVELLVVIIVIGILSAIAVPVYLNQKQKAMETSLKSDIKQMQIQQTDFMIENGENTRKFANIAVRSPESDKTNPNGDSTHNRHELAFNPSENNWVKVVGAYDRSKGTTDDEIYCIMMWNPLSSKYNAENKAMVYRSDLGTILPDPMPNCGSVDAYK